MIPIRETLNKYSTMYMASKALGVEATTLKRLYDADAFHCPYTGAVYIKSKTRTKVVL